LYGIDYSPQAIELAQGIAKSRDVECHFSVSQPFLKLDFHLSFWLQDERNEKMEKWKNKNLILLSKRLRLQKIVLRFDWLLKNNESAALEK